MTEVAALDAVTETPQQAARRLAANVIAAGLEPVALHTYTDANGDPLYWKLRLKHPNPCSLSAGTRRQLDIHDDKWLRPMCRNGHGFKLGEPKFPGKKPLYNLHLLNRSSGPVWVVEGEQKADKLNELGILATTSGAATSADGADWTPVQGREVVIWPDNDTAGKGYAGQVAQILVALGCSVSCVDVELLGLPPKGDVVDWLEETYPNATKSEVLALRRLPAANKKGGAEAAQVQVGPGGNKDALKGGEQLLDEVLHYLCRFVAYPSEHAAVAHALWVVHTHLMDAWESTPRIALLSPEPGSGKSRALEASELLVPNPVNAVNVSVAYLFRKVGDEQSRPTILYDEVDTVFTAKGENDDIRGLLNAGHRKHSIVGRCVVHGKRIETEETPAYSAVALAGLGDLPDTILTRSVVVRMRRRAPSEPIEPYRRREVEQQANALRQRIAAWAGTVFDTVHDARPEFPPGVADRDADVWEALLAVADAVGGDWPARARAAAVAMLAESKQGTPSLGVRLLGDLRILFGGADRLTTDAILKALTEMEEAPWGDLRGKALDARGLAVRLRPYGIGSKNLRVDDGRVAKGYERADLQDAWARYLSLSPHEGATSATSATPAVPAAPVAHVAPVAHTGDERETTDERVGVGGTNSSGEIEVTI